MRVKESLAASIGSELVQSVRKRGPISLALNPLPRGEEKRGRPADIEHASHYRASAIAQASGGFQIAGACLNCEEKRPPTGRGNRQRCSGPNLELGIDC